VDDAVIVGDIVDQAVTQQNSDLVDRELDRGDCVVVVLGR
jgi:hypothetical protein